MKKIFYEMKSVDDVPPGHFKEQFMKDLMNSEVTGLDQIRWRFNRAKNPEQFRDRMMDAIDKLELTDDLAKKFFPLRPEAGYLKSKIKENIDEIFKTIKE